MKNILIILLTVAMLVGCAGGQVRKDMVHDLVAGTSTIKTVMIYFSIPPLSSASEDILFQRITSAHDVRYGLVVDDRGKDWRFMDGPIKRAIGGRAMTLEAARPSRDVVYGGVTETLNAAVPPEVVEELFASDDIQIQYWREPSRLTKEGISYLRKLSPQNPYYCGVTIECPQL